MLDEQKMIVTEADECDSAFSDLSGWLDELSEQLELAPSDKQMTERLCNHASQITKEGR